MSTDIDIDLLISLVHERPELWDRTMEEYKDKVKVREKWRQICAVLNPTFEELNENEKKTYGNLVLKRWCNTRDSYMKWKNREKQSKKSGAGASKMRKYIYHDALQFLDRVRTHAETTSSIEQVREEEEQNSNAEQIDEPLAPESQPSTSGTQGHPPAPSPTESILSKKARKGNIPKKKFDDFELKMIELVEAPEPEPDRHLMFFKGILPTLSKFNDIQTVDFQIGVLQLMKDIQKQQSTDHRNPATFNQWNVNPFPAYGNYAPPPQPPQYMGSVVTPPSQRFIGTGPPFQPQQLIGPTPQQHDSSSTFQQKSLLTLQTPVQIAQSGQPPQPKQSDENMQLTIDTTDHLVESAQHSKSPDNTAIYSPYSDIM